MSNNNTQTQVVVYSASELNIEFPKKNINITNKEARHSRSLIVSEGAYTSDGRAFVGSKSLSALLATDEKGAKRFYSNLNNDDKYENANKLLASVASVQKEISKRIQEPRDTLKREKLRDNEDCIKAFRDHPTLEKMREVEESKIRKQLPSLKKKKIKAESITKCQLTETPLEEDCELHHITRRADEPRRSLDPNNAIIINKKTHTEITNYGAESPAGLKELGKKKNWNVSDIK